MCRKPNEARTAKLTSAQRILVTGRRGFNEEINGVYDRVDDLFQGKTCYVHVESDWCIYWSRIVQRWVFDHRGLLNDEKGSAISDEDVPVPHLVKGDWVVYKGASCGWQPDPNLKVKPWLEGGGMQSLHFSRASSNNFTILSSSHSRNADIDDD